MAYDVEKFAKLGALKELGQRAKAAADANANKIEKIKVNGVELTINSADKSVDITAPSGGGTSVDLSGYVQKEEGMGLSSNDYTNEEKAKLASIDFATEAEVTEMLNEVFGA